jgi:homotetrameric cytidine deaminase
MDIKDLYKINYVPYSKKPSAALVRSQTGIWFPGIRIENISYPLSITAVQNALFCCLSEGQQPVELYIEEIDDNMASYWQNEFDLSIYPLEEKSLDDITVAELSLNGEINPEQKLTELLDQAVVEESDFPVSAIIETEQGFFSGVNVECSAWNMGLCAERIAITKALTHGSKNLKRLHIHTKDGEFSSPCGACRQVIIEHLPNRQIHLHHADHSKSIHFSNDLLPHSFSSSSLSNK